MLKSDGVFFTFSLFCCLSFPFVFAITFMPTHEKKMAENLLPSHLFVAYDTEESKRKTLQRRRPNRLELFDNVFRHFETHGLFRIYHLANTHVARQREQHGQLIFIHARALMQDIQHIMDRSVNRFIKRFRRCNGRFP